MTGVQTCALPIYYFYLVGYIEGINKAEHFDNSDDAYPTIYRVDRIKEIKTTDIHFAVPYRDRFEEGEFRKRVQFMYGGKIGRASCRERV